MKTAHKWSNGDKLRDVIDDIITSCLAQVDNNVSVASRELGISRAAIYNHLKRIRRHNPPLSRVPSE